MANLSKKINSITASYNEERIENIKLFLSNIAEIKDLTKQISDIEKLSKKVNEEKVILYNETGRKKSILKEFSLEYSKLIDQKKNLLNINRTDYKKLTKNIDIDVENNVISSENNYDPYQFITTENLAPFSIPYYDLTDQEKLDYWTKRKEKILELADSPKYENEKKINTIRIEGILKPFPKKLVSYYLETKQNIGQLENNISLNNSNNNINNFENNNIEENISNQSNIESISNEDNVGENLFVQNNIIENIDVYSNVDVLNIPDKYWNVNYVDNEKRFESYNFWKYKKQELDNYIIKSNINNQENMVFKYFKISKLMLEMLEKTQDASDDIVNIYYDKDDYILQYCNTNSAIENALEYWNSKKEYIEILLEYQNKAYNIINKNVFAENIESLNNLLNMSNKIIKELESRKNNNLVTSDQSNNEIYDIPDKYLLPNCNTINEIEEAITYWNNKKNLIDNQMKNSVISKIDDNVIVKNRVSSDLLLNFSMCVKMLEKLNKKKENINKPEINDEIEDYIINIICSNVDNIESINEGISYLEVKKDKILAKSNYNKEDIDKIDNAINYLEEKKRNLENNLVYGTEQIDNLDNTKKPKKAKLEKTTIERKKQLKKKVTKVIAGIVAATILIIGGIHLSRNTHKNKTNLEPTTEVVTEVPTNTTNYNNEEHTRNYRHEEVQENQRDLAITIGDKVTIKKDAYIYKTAQDAYLGTNKLIPYFDGEETRVVEAIGFKNSDGNIEMVWGNDPKYEEKINMHLANGDEIATYLTNLVDNFDNGYEGFYSAKDTKPEVGRRSR